MIRPYRFLTAVALAHILCLSPLAQLAPSLLERAATGDATAMHLIGRAAVSGGKPVEAYAWFSLAAEYGVETAEKSSLLSALSPAQVTEAARRVEEIRSLQLRGLPPPAKRPAARIVETRRAVEQTPAAPAVTAPEPQAQPDAQEAQIAKLEADLAAARDEVRDEKKQSEESAARLESALAKAAQERDALAAEISGLRRDKQRAEESLAQLQARPPLDGQIESQKAQIAKLEADLAAARSEANAAKSRSADAASRLEAALAQTSKERDALSVEAAALRKDKQRSDEALAELRAQPSLEGQVQAQKAQITQLEASLAALRQERQRAEEARDQIRAEHAAVRSKLESDLIAARTEASAAKAEAAEAVEAVTKLETALAQSGKESDTLTAEVAALKTDKQRAEETLAQLKAQPSLESQVQTQKAQIAKLESDLASAHAEARAARAQAGEATARLEPALADANNARDALAGEVAALRRDKERAEESLAQLRARPAVDPQVETQRAQIAKLETDLAAARSEAQAARARAEESATKLEAALAKAGPDQGANSKEIATLRQERLAAEQARDRMRAELSAARSKLEDDLAAARNEARIAKAYATKLESDLAAARPEVRSGESQFGGPEVALRVEPLRPAVPVPVDNPPPALPRVHTVTSGESLSSISQRYYGTPNRWEEIFDANRDVLDRPNQLSLGTRLRIP